MHLAATSTHQNSALLAACTAAVGIREQASNLRCHALTKMTGGRKTVGGDCGQSQVRGAIRDPLLSEGTASDRTWHRRCPNSPSLGTYRVEGGSMCVQRRHPGSLKVVLAASLIAL